MSLGAAVSGAAAGPEPGGVANAADVGSLARRVGAEEHAIQRRLDETKAKLDRLEILSVARGRAYVRLARAGLLPVGGGLGALIDHATHLERLRQAVGKDLDAIERLSAERLRLARKLAELRDHRGALDQERAALARSHAAIAAAEERERAFQRAFQTSYKPDHTAVYAGAGPLSGADVEEGFGRMRGRLPFPLAGRTEIQAVEREAGEGLEMAAPVGETVRAVFPGRVAFADSYADYGRTVIIQHGGGYYTVSGGLGSVEVHPGDEVAAGDPVGSVGASEGGAALYFEVRKGSETVDPSEWFGI